MNHLLLYDLIAAAFNTLALCCWLYYPLTPPLLLTKIPIVSIQTQLNAPSPAFRRHATIEVCCEGNIARSDSSTPSTRGGANGVAVI